MNHQITLTDEQFDAAADALEFTSRFLAGQVDMYNLPKGLRYSERVGRHQDEISNALRILRHYLFPELSPGQSYGIGEPWDKEPIARDRVVLYEIYRTMLEHKVQLRIGAGEDVGPNVYAHPGLNYTGLPKPGIKTEES